MSKLAGRCPDIGILKDANNILTNYISSHENEKALSSFHYKK